jgi:pimeloyl-ACP methyl ester carboxylesterase
MTEGTINRAISEDGTEIGYFTSGEGPPLLLVHGGLGDHSRWDALRPHLESQRTIHAMDRRGRGTSGDHPNYDIAREFEDVAAVIDAIAEASDHPVDIYAHSAGGIYTVGAAQSTSNIRSIVIYEGWDWVNPEDKVPPLSVLEQMDKLIAKGNREGACELLFSEVIGVNENEMEEVRALPSWPGRVAIVHTVSREVQSFLNSGFNPQRSGNILVPMMLMVGAESPENWKSDAEAFASTLPNVRIEILEGQGHSADMLAPALVTEKLLSFLNSLE